VNLIEEAKRFFSLSRKRAEPSVSEGTRSLLTKAMPLCPLCRQEITAHRYQHIASTPLGEQSKDSFKRMMSAVRSHQWDEVVRFQDWEATSADADVYVLGCPDGRFLMSVIYCPYQLEDIYKLLHYEQVEAFGLPIKADAWLPV
jgi:hypothetical protein